MSGEHQVCPMCGDDMCDGRCYDALLDRLANKDIDLAAKDRRIAELEAELDWWCELARREIKEDSCSNLPAYIKNLRETVAKLPTTADGVPVVPGESVWKLTFGPRGGVKIEEIEVGVGSESGLHFVDGHNDDLKEWMPYAETGDCYSNRQAAEAAAELAD